MGFAFSWTAHIEGVGQKFPGAPDMTKRKAKITLTQLELLRSKMIAMPAKQKTEFNDGEAINLLATEIRRLIADGYSFVDIAGMVAEVDASISPSTIAACLRDASKVSGDKNKRAKKPTKSSVLKPTEGIVSPPQDVVALTSMMGITEKSDRLPTTTDIAAVLNDTVRTLSSDLENHAPEIEEADVSAADVSVAVKVVQRPIPNEIRKSDDPTLAGD